jgi:hypothetical protein
LKGYAVKMMFKDAIILKSEPVDDKTIEEGMVYLRKLLELALLKILKAPAPKE